MRNGTREGAGSPRAWRLRLRFARRWSTPALSLVVLALSMGSAVRRSADARHQTRRLTELSQAEQSTREALAGAMHRADSLGSRERIKIAAGALGLHEPGDRVTLLPEPREDRR